LFFLIHASEATSCQSFLVGFLIHLFASSGR
jgi:hypothetical protein